MSNSLDQKLISALRHDARASLSNLAILLGVSRTTVRARIDRLQQSGEILGFSVVLKDDAKEGIDAFIEKRLPDWKDK